jgi:hypothetical protein
LLDEGPEVLMVGDLPLDLLEFRPGPETLGPAVPPDLGHEEVLRPMARMVEPTTGAGGLAAPPVVHGDGAAPEVADLGELLVQARPLRFEMPELVWHVAASFLNICVYSEYHVQHWLSISPTFMTHTRVRSRIDTLFYMIYSD